MSVKLIDISYLIYGIQPSQVFFFELASLESFVIQIANLRIQSLNFKLLLVSLLITL